MTELSIHEIADRLRQRAGGDPGALEGLWAEEDTVSTVNFIAEETRLSGAEREARLRAEAEAMAAMVGLDVESTFHVSEDTGTIIEVVRTTGTFAGERMTIPACIIYTAKNGRLKRLEFFADSVQMAAMAGGASSA